MKLKINKACDLSSISVLPPPARRSSTILNGPDSSVFGRSHGSQLRSQPSQQSFSQGISSQNGMFSQLSQNSLDEILTNDQRICSQEKDSLVKKNFCLPTVGYTREESQMAISRSSTNPLSKWNSTSTLADHRSQKNEELDHRIWSMETSLNRFTMILDSVQTDIMQMNKGTKEVLMEMEGIRKKLNANDNLLQQMNKGQEEINSNLVGGLKSLSNQVSQDLYGERLKQISSVITDLQGQIDVHLQQLKPELCKSVAQQMQAMACSLKTHSQIHSTPTIQSPKELSCRATPKQMPPLKKPELHPEVCGKEQLIPKVEAGSWTSVKRERATITYGRHRMENKEKRPSPTELERQWKISIESDEEIDGGFSCLLEENETGNYLVAEAEQETERILRKARRRKRKSQPELRSVRGGSSALNDMS